jgi:alcohol dehydrogenase
VLLVTGAGSLAGSGREDRLRAALAEAGATVVGPLRVTSEPGPELVDGAVAEHRAADIEVVLAVGGGSAIDAAKALGGLLRTNTSIRDHLEGVGPGLPYPGPAVPLVAVPTTAGTGSEATRNAVITERGPDGFKRSFRDERLVAADAVVDPDLLAGATPERIAANGMDALTQLLESLVSLRAGPFTDALALGGLEAVRDGLRAWHADPDGPRAPAARTSMAYAALLSGICLANAGLGAVHGLASPLGARFPVPHGAACGAVAAEVTAANLAALRSRVPGSPALERYARAGRILADLGPGVGSREAGEALVSTLRAWAAILRVPGLAAYGISEADLPAIVADARGGSMRANPVELTDGELTEVLRASL